MAWMPLQIERRLDLHSLAMRPDATEVERRRVELQYRISSEVTLAGFSSQRSGAQSVEMMKFTVIFA